MVKKIVNTTMYVEFCNGEVKLKIWNDVGNNLYCQTISISDKQRNRFKLSLDVSYTFSIRSVECPDWMGSILYIAGSDKKKDERITPHHLRDGESAELLFEALKPYATKIEVEEVELKDSYSLDKEDLIINNIFRHADALCLQSIEIGVGDASFSNTLLLTADRGTSPIFVEPNRKSYDIAKKKLNMYGVNPSRVVNLVIDNSQDIIDFNGTKRYACTVPFFRKIFNFNFSDCCQFMSINTKKSGLSILKSMFNTVITEAEHTYKPISMFSPLTTETEYTYKPIIPKVICISTHDKKEEWESPNYNDILELMKAHSYYLVGKTNSNSIFVRKGFIKKCDAVKAFKEIN